MIFRIKREERIERQQEQLRRKANDMDEWRKELTVFREEVRLILSLEMTFLVDFILLKNFKRYSRKGLYGV